MGTIQLCAVGGGNLTTFLQLETQNTK